MPRVCGTVETGMGAERQICRTKCCCISFGLGEDARALRFTLKSSLKGLGACWRGAGNPEHQEEPKRPSTMKTHHVLAVLLGSTLLPASSQAQLKAEDSKWYVKGEVGPSFVNNITTTSTDFF